MCINHCRSVVTTTKPQFGYRNADIFKTHEPHRKSAYEHEVPVRTSTGSQCDVCTHGDRAAHLELKIFVQVQTNLS